LNDLILILAVVLPTVTFGLWWVLRPREEAQQIALVDTPAILVRDGVIEHATGAALEQLPIAIGLHNWEDLHDILSPRYPDFPRAPLPTTTGETVVRGESGEIRISWQDAGASIVFHNTSSATVMTHDLEELALLRQVTDTLPFPAWKSNMTGTVDWHNEAYAKLKSRMSADGRKAHDPIFEMTEMKDGADSARVKIVLEGSDKHEWFDVTCKLVDQGKMYHATSLTTLIHAEEAQRDFVQTLAKTFAHLSIGLAIFNRNRQLALFNPALTDLTGLSASFLSPRPTIDSFFDAMRENRRMPEPKNYKTWRQRMADLISAAETGRFEETWTLETGQTYRVTGRPHPDGAIAFLIEDISAEVSLTRNFRAELELGQSLVDTFEDALAVFSQTGVLTFSNKAYDVLWGFENNTSFADVTITDAVRLWKEKTSPNPMWQDLQDAVMKLESREEWDMPVCIKGQTPMQCRVVPIASGATVVRFSRNSNVHTPPKEVLGKAQD
jgi:PAS domain-containing protein